MTEAQFGMLYERLRQQSPWGPGDRRGALNYTTSAEVRAARSRVRLGRVISLAAPVEHQATADNPDPAQHHMKEPLAMNVVETRTGLHPTVLPLLAERQIAALGGDGNNDIAPVQS